MGAYKNIMIEVEGAIETLEKYTRLLSESFGEELVNRLEAVSGIQTACLQFEKETEEMWEEDE